MRRSHETTNTQAEVVHVPDQSFDSITSIHPIRSINRTHPIHLFTNRGNPFLYSIQQSNNSPSVDWSMLSVRLLFWRAHLVCFLVVPSFSPSPIHLICSVQSELSIRSIAPIQNYSAVSPDRNLATTSRCYGRSQFVELQILGDGGQKTFVYNREYLQEKIDDTKRAEEYVAPTTMDSKECAET